MSSSSSGTDIVPPTPSPVRMNGHKAKAPSPAESLCSVQCEATEPLQAGARKRIRDAPDCGLQPVGSINVEGVVSLDLLISEFRKTMNEVLDDRMAAIIVEVEELKNTCKELKERIEVLEHRNRKLTCTVESLGRSDASRTHPSPVAGPQLDHTVREIVLEERRQHDLQDNVIISGLPESDGENLTQLVSGLVPEVNPTAITVRRIGKPLENKPRLVHVRTDPGTKARLLKHRFGLKHGTHSIYINHDLTRQQQDTRRRALPTFKQLRAKGIRCTLPLDIILVEGKPVSQQDIQ